MMQLQRSVLLPYSSADVYRLVNEVASYPFFLPSCISAEVLEASETHMIAKLKVEQLGQRHTLITRNTLVPNHSIEMHLVEGPFQRFHGRWLFKALDEHSCKVILELEFESKGLLQRLIQPLLAPATNKVLDAFCKQAEKIYGKR